MIAAAVLIMFWVLFREEEAVPADHEVVEAERSGPARKHRNGRLVSPA